MISKSNLLFEFQKEGNLFHINVLDPLGCCWYSGIDIYLATEKAMERLDYLTSITRQATTPSKEDKSLVLKWYFDQFKQKMYPSDKKISMGNNSDITEFISLVHEYAEEFHRLMDPGPNVKRFLGNCSLKPIPPQVGRCSKGMPSFKSGDYVFVSKRNVNKEYIGKEHFVPCYMKNGKIYYCGDEKPSVDTPIQLRLYKALPNIRYMIHSHCYIANSDTPYTKRVIPCGAIEEVDEILNIIDTMYHTRNAKTYKINLIGHGSILMSNSVEGLKNVSYLKRPMPEKIYTL